jgi:hypothetical protein
MVSVAVVAPLVAAAPPLFADALAVSPVAATSLTAASVVAAPSVTITMSLIHFSLCLSNGNDVTDTFLLPP